MTRKYRTEDGEELDPDQLEVGKECVRCGGFIKIRSDDELPPKKGDAGADRTHVALTDYVGENKPHVVDDWKGDICPDCSDDLKDFLFSHDSAEN
jgi:hypothetical protein